MPTHLRVLSTLAVMGAMRDLVTRYQARSSQIIDVDFAPTVALLERLRAGEPADLAILTAQSLDDLITQGLIRPGSRVDIARSYVGIAVKAGAAKPDISTLDALRETLVTARSVAYSRIGASGIYFASLVERLGIAQAVNAKAMIVPSGFTAERLVSDEADLAVQQISELMIVPGIEVVGPLPLGAQTVAVFSAGVPSSAEQPAQAADFARFMASDVARPVLQATGLDPA